MLATPLEDLQQLSGLQTTASRCITSSCRPSPKSIYPNPYSKDFLKFSFFRYHQTASTNVLKGRYIGPTFKEKKINWGYFARITYCKQAYLFQTILPVNTFSYLKITTIWQCIKCTDSMIVFASIHILGHIDQAINA